MCLSILLMYAFTDLFYVKSNQISYILHVLHFIFILLIIYVFEEKIDFWYEFNSKFAVGYFLVF